MKNLKKLLVWQKGIHLVKDIYQISKDFPKEELYGLTSQMRRCSVSIQSNIAEGSGQGTDKSFSHFLDISQGSAFELETQTIIAFELGYIPESNFNKLNSGLDEIQKMIAGLQKSLKQSS
jgi:four helix bundle protein